MQMPDGSGVATFETGLGARGRAFEGGEDED